MATPKIRLTKDKEPYLATLYGKALDAAVAHPILGDHFAADAVARIDFDFRALKLPAGARSPCRCGPGTSTSGRARSSPRTPSPRSCTSAVASTPVSIASTPGHRCAGSTSTCPR